MSTRAYQPGMMLPHISWRWPQPQIKRRWIIVLILLLVACMFLELLLNPGHVQPLDLQSWTSSIAKITSGPQTAATTTAPQAEPTTVSTGQGTSTELNASSVLKRISQLDPSEYASPVEYNTWAYSACSAAAITEVLNAYGNHYRITDILSVESQIGEITPQLGLLEEVGIANTALRFGFTTTWGHNLSLDQVIAAANSGTPVIVSWPPQVYNGGHIVVVTGGTRDTVKLADSSLYNRTSLSRIQFSAWWRGFSAIPRPFAKTSYSVLGKPTITAAFINQVLTSYHSPAAGLGQDLYDRGVKYGIDPVYALAFFMHESLFGTTGEARVTLSLGNERCIPDRPCIDQDRGGYAKMNSWQDGFEHWYQLIRNLYVMRWGRVTVAQIIPKYAPNSDGNNEAEYIAGLKHEVDVWRAGGIRP